MKSEPFTIDLADPSAIDGKLAEVEDRVMKEREALREVRERLTYWELLYQRLNALAGGDGIPARTGPQSIRKRIAEIINESDLPLDVDYFMQLLPPGTKRKTVSWNLWDMERKKEIQRVTDGVYARLGFERDKLIED